MIKNKFRSFAAVALAATGLGLIAAAVVGRAKADTWDKTTYVTLHERVIAGNKVLEPGTYVWKLLDSQSDRHVVQIFDKDQTHLEETIIAIPNYRLQPAGDTRFAFWETPAGVPKAIRAWFYPGDNFGQEFKFPKKLVAQFASTVVVPVSANYKEPEATPAAAEPSPQPEPKATAAEPASTEPAPEPAPQTTPVASNTAAPTPAEPAPALPHTASNIPLIGLLGVASIGLAGLVSRGAKRS